MTTESKTKAPVSHFVSVDEAFFKQFGITNDAKTPISRSYVNAYVQCWCRKANGYADTATVNRKQLFAYFNSDAYLAECVALGITTGSAIGERASLDPKWGNGPVEFKAQNAKRKTVPVSPAPVAPAIDAVDATNDPEKAAFEAAGLVIDAKMIIAEPTAEAVVAEPASSEPAAVETALAESPQHQAKQTRRERLAKQMADAIPTAA
jgi:hypothetical protein